MAFIEREESSNDRARTERSSDGDGQVKKDKMEKPFQRITKTEEHGTRDASYKKAYDHVKLELEQHAIEIKELKKKLEETSVLLNKERARSRHLQAVNRRLERDVDRITFDQEELCKESEITDQLLESKDKEIGSLVA